MFTTIQLGDAATITGTYWPGAETLLRFEGAEVTSVSPPAGLAGACSFDPVEKLLRFTADYADLELNPDAKLAFQLQGNPPRQLVLSPRPLHAATIPTFRRAPGPVPDPEDVLVTEQVSAEKTMFNGADRKTRTMRAAGMRIVLTGEPRGRLGQLLSRVEDVAELTLIADTIKITGRVVLPGCQVNLFARSLVFEGDGAIDTTPLPFLAPAMDTIDGTTGQRGGDIKVAAREIVQDAQKKRFFLSGGKGQDGGSGGVAADGPALPVLDDVDNFTVTTRNMHLMSGTMDWTIKDARWRTEATTLSVADQRDLLRRAVCIEFWEAGVIISRQKFGGDGFNDTGKMARFRELPNFKELGLKAHWGNWEWPADAKKLVGNIPAGRGGDGGRGGDLRVNAAQWKNGLPTSAYEANGGEAGKNGPACEVLAAPPKPSNPTRVKLVVWRGVMEIDDAIWVEKFDELDLSPTKAAEPAADAARHGAPGSFASEDVDWRHPALLDAVVDHARRLHRAHRLTEAAALVSDYEGHLAKASTSTQPDEKARHAALASLRRIQSQINRGLDAFGLPEGWVPMLSLGVTIDAYNKAIESGIPVLVTSRRVLARYAELSSTAAELDHAVDALLTQRETEAMMLPFLAQQMTTAQKELQSAAEHKRAVDADLQKQTDELVRQAHDKVQERRRIRGIARIFGGLLQMVPVGQPWTGIAGHGLDFISEMALPDAKKDSGVDSSLSMPMMMMPSTTGEDSLDEQLKEDRRNEQGGAVARATARTSTAERERIRTEHEQALQAATAKANEIRRGHYRSVLGSAFTEEMTLDQLRRASTNLPNESQKLLRRALAEANRSESEARKTLNATMTARRAEFKREDDERVKLAKQKAARKAKFNEQMNAVLMNMYGAETSLKSAIADFHVPDDEVKAEFEQMRTSNYDYQELTSSATKALAVLEQRQMGVSVAQEMISSSVTNIAKASDSIDAINMARDGAIQALDPVLADHFRAMERRTLERLAYYWHLVRRAYEFRMLEPLPDANGDLEFLVQKLDTYEPKPDKDGRYNDAFADDLKAMYCARVQAVADAIFDQASRNDQAYESEFFYSLTPAELRELNRTDDDATGSVVIDLVSIGVLPLYDQNVRLEAVGLKEDGGLVVTPNPDSPLTLDFWFEHEGVSVVRTGTKLYTFNTRSLGRKDPSDGADSAGRTWNSTCTVGDEIDGKPAPAKIVNSIAEREMNDLLTGLLKTRDGQSAKQIRYSAPGACAKIRIVRSFPATLIRIKRLVLRFKLTRRKSGQPDGTVLILGDSQSLAPLVQVSAVDANGLGDARGGTLRVYRNTGDGPGALKPGEKLRLCAPAAVGNQPFAYWRVINLARNAEQVKRTRDIAIDLAHDTRVVPMYGTCGGFVRPAELRAAGFQENGPTFRFPSGDALPAVEIAFDAVAPFPNNGADLIPVKSLVLCDARGNWFATPKVGGFDFLPVDGPDWAREESILSAMHAALLGRLPEGLLVDNARLVVHHPQANPRFRLL